MNSKTNRIILSQLQTFVRFLHVPTIIEGASVCTYTYTLRSEASMPIIINGTPLIYQDNH